MLNVEIWPLAGCLALFTLTQVVYSFPVPPSHSLPPVLPILILFAPSTVIYLSDLYLSTANKLREHAPPPPPPPQPHFICSPAFASSSSGTPPPPSHLLLLFLLQVLAAELWGVMSEWGMGSASGGCRCGCGGSRTGTLDAGAGFVCVAESCLCLIVLHCCLRRTGMWQVGWFMTGCGQVCVWVWVCVFDCAGASLTTT